MTSSETASLSLCRESVMPPTSITLHRLPIEARALRDHLADAGWEVLSAPHAFFRARTDDANAVFYESGKLLIQGKGAESAAHRIEAFLGGTAAGEAPRAAARPVTASLDDVPEHVQRWIGIDEAGKGDFFGPLVVTAAAVDRSDAGWLMELGVNDSKAMTDARIIALAPRLEGALAHETIVLEPTRYNELHARMNNVNRMLAWAHARAAERVFEATGADMILSDQFAAAPIVADQFRIPEARAVWTQRTRAESDLAVACASILARARFLAGMDALERRHGVRLHRGAGPPVLAAGRALVRQRGPDLLPSVAKMHFKTAQQVLGS